MSSHVDNPPLVSDAPAHPDDAPGAVVIGGDHQGLGILRSLGRRGVATCVIDDEYSISRFSRYCTHFVSVPSLREERVIVDAVLAAGRRLNLAGWVLYPTREEVVAAFSRHRDELSAFFRVPTPNWDSVRWAWDKRNTQCMAEQLGIPAPITHYPQHASDLGAFEKLQPPFVVKPAIKERFVYATKVKAWRADSLDELKILLKNSFAIMNPGEVMIQELIPGGGAQQFAYCAFFREGVSVGRMVACRRRQHPLQFGKASTYVVTVDLPILEEYSERFLKAIDYYGLVELEYKLDLRDNRYKLLDVNARTWGYHSIGARAGVDFSYMLYADQVGLSVAPCSACSGVGWVRMVTDLPAGIIAIAAGETGFQSYVSSLKNCNVEAVFTKGDLLPGLAEIALIPYLAVKRGF